MQTPLFFFFWIVIRSVPERLDDGPSVCGENTTALPEASALDHQRADKEEQKGGRSTGAPAECTPTGSESATRPATLKNLHTLAGLYLMFMLSCFLSRTPVDAHGRCTSQDTHSCTPAQILRASSQKSVLRRACENILSRRKFELTTLVSLIQKMVSAVNNE